MTSPGKRVAPTGIGAPFNFASFPLMLVAEAAGPLAGVAPLTGVAAAAAQRTPAARKKEIETEWKVLLTLLPILTGAFVCARENDFMSCLSPLKPEWEIVRPNSG
jgi:hypothetical protein